MKEYSKRYFTVAKNGKVRCPYGTAHLVDKETECCSTGLYKHILETLVPKNSINRFYFSAD